MARSQPTRRFGAACLALIVLPTGCSGGRSTEAFCETLESEQDRIASELESALDDAQSQDDELLGLFMMLGASVQGLGELRTYTQKLAEVAPEEIEVEMNLVAEGIDEQFDAAKDAGSNPLGALATGLFNSFTYAGPMSTVDEFARDNCGQGL